jgi:hypothetical protein
MRRGQEWGILVSGDNYGPYTTEQEAINSAIEAADVARTLGYASRVVVLGSGGHFRTAWTHEQEMQGAE